MPFYPGGRYRPLVQPYRSAAYALGQSVAPGVTLLTTGGRQVRGGLFNPLDYATSGMWYGGAAYKALGLGEGVAISSVPNEAFAGEPFVSQGADPLHYSDGVQFNATVGQRLVSSSARPNLSGWSMIIGASLSVSGATGVPRLCMCPNNNRIFQLNNSRQTGPNVNGAMGVWSEWTAPEDPKADWWYLQEGGSVINPGGAWAYRGSDGAILTNTTVANVLCLDFTLMGYDAASMSPDGRLKFFWAFDTYARDEPWWDDLKAWATAQLL